MLSSLNQIIWYLTRIYGALLTYLLEFKLSLIEDKHYYLKFL